MPRSTASPVLFFLLVRMLFSQSHCTGNCSRTKTKLCKSSGAGTRVGAAATAARVTITMMMMAMAGARTAVVVERVGAMSALAAIIISGARGCIYGNGTQCTGTDVAADTTHATGHIFSSLLATTTEQFCSADADQRTLRQMASVVRVIVDFTSLLADIDHAVVTAVVLVIASSGSLRDRVAGAELAPEATIIIILTNPAMVVVARVTFHFGSVDNLIIGLTGRGIDGGSSCIKLNGLFWLTRTGRSTYVRSSLARSDSHNHRVGRSRRHARSVAP